MFSRPKILFLVSLLFVALLNPKFNPYLLFKYLIFYHSLTFTTCTLVIYFACAYRVYSHKCLGLDLDVSWIYLYIAIHVMKMRSHDIAVL